MGTNVPASLKNLFQSDVETCYRCKGRVYQMEKVGPINSVLFHKTCFSCCKCPQHLTMKTYYPNQVDLTDNEIYCLSHYPKTQGRGIDANAVGMRTALQAQKTKNMTRDIPGFSSGQAPLIGADAMFITGPVNAQERYGKKYKHTFSKHHFPAYVVNKQKEKLWEAQQELERQQREEEDRLMAKFKEERHEMKAEIENEMEQEWEIQLKELTAKFDQDMNKTKKGKYEKNSGNFEKEKSELKKNMTVKLKNKKEIMTLRIQKKEQAETAELVKDHSKKMLELLQQNKEELKKEIESELEKNKDLDVNDNDSEGGEGYDPAQVLEEALAAVTLPTELPPPHPPTCRKRDLYLDPSFFKELDEEVFAVAERDQSTFTELVKELTVNCYNDLMKARAIFRWITVKDLNVLEIDEALDLDSPLGLLRGIKYGTETYHTLFMRLCSYAGLPCVEIKGHSKSVGYEPGMKIRPDTFQNTWNAVLLDGDWWPVQCNWGARHLVLNKDVPDKQVVKNKKQDKIRYQYDEHYFLTDPDEFIQEFWASDEAWQLLQRPISLEEFEAMPFVRSVFFHYGLEFEKPLKATLYTDEKGGTEVKIRVPTEFSKDIVFHYQIRFADRERRNDTEFRGAKLERFVFHSLVDGHALFSVHVPIAAPFFLEIFANKIDETNRIGDDPNATMMPFRLKCACKFKVICESLSGKMHPLPNCASGEWGPSKGARHFGLKPMTHMSGVVNVDNDAEVQFRLPRKLHILCKLRMNGVEDHKLEQFISHAISEERVLTIKVKPPQPGQYGLDIYARPEDAADNHTLAHACKYLLNCTRVDTPREIQISKVDPAKKMPKEKWGPCPEFDELGLKAISHKEPTIEKDDSSTLVIEIGTIDPVKMTYQLFREPDEDCRDKVTVKENGKKVKFSINLAKPGKYLFAIYARKKKDADSNMNNVYNYQIRYSPDDSTLKKKKKGLFSKKGQ